MTVTWTLELHCKSCGAYVTWDSEIPEIKRDRNNIILNNKAREFVKDHTFFEPHLIEPQGVVTKWMGKQLERYVIENELPERYTICPVCAERIYFE